MIQKCDKEMPFANGNNKIKNTLSNSSCFIYFFGVVVGGGIKLKKNFKLNESQMGLIYQASSFRNTVTIRNHLIKILLTATNLR